MAHIYLNKEDDDWLRSVASTPSKAIALLKEIYTGKNGATAKLPEKFEQKFNKVVEILESHDDALASHGYFGNANIGGLKL